MSALLSSCFFVITPFHLFVVGFSELAAKLDERAGTRRRVKKILYSESVALAHAESASCGSRFCEWCKIRRGDAFPLSGAQVRCGNERSRLQRVWATFPIGQPLAQGRHLLRPPEYASTEKASGTYGVYYRVPIEYGAKPFVKLGEGYPFPDELIPKHSRVFFMTFVGCLCDLLRVVVGVLPYSADLGSVSVYRWANR